MRKLFGGLAILGAAAGAGIALRNYLQESAGSARGDVRITLEGGTELKTEPAEAREFVDIARRVLEISG